MTMLTTKYRSPLVENENIKDVDWDLLIELSIFADKYDLPDLQNATIDIIIAKEETEHTIPTNLLGLIYNNTVETSPLRRFFVVWCAHRGEMKPWIQEIKNMHSEDDNIPPYQFMLDLALELFAITSHEATTYNWENLGCQFHTHPTSTLPCRQQGLITKARGES